jgi:hypothetical protein
VPETLSSGTHEITVSFLAPNDTYAASKTNLQFEVPAPSNSTFSSTTQMTQPNKTATPALTNALMIPVIAAIFAFALSVYFAITHRRKPETISENIQPSPTKATSDNSTKTSTDVHCEFCGRFIPRNSNYCDHCGKPNLLKDQS